MTLAAAHAQSPSHPQSLPTAQQVMDRFVAAQGGHDVIFRHRSMTVRATLVLQPKNVSLGQVSWLKDGKALQETTFPDGSRDRTGFDGAVAWDIDPKDGPNVAKGDVIQSVARDADMHYFGHILDYFKSMEVVEIAAFAGHTCYHLKGVNNWGIRNEQFYDTTSGLLVGYRFDSSWRGGPGEEHEVFSDYKSFDGWLMPTSDVQSNAKGSATTTTLSVTFDDLPDSMFALPEPIKALVAKRGAS
ncbi:MAG TPA: hypothetical protein VLZ50_08135 [Terracidiphilus sp.]|nr:hypothetical protein [Terracidiphilus sp.]